MEQEMMSSSYYTEFKLTDAQMRNREKKILVKALETTIGLPLASFFWADKLLACQYYHPYFRQRNFVLNNGIEAMYFNYLKNGLWGCLNIPAFLFDILVIGPLDTGIMHRVRKWSMMDKASQEGHQNPAEAQNGDNNQVEEFPVFNENGFSFTKKHIKPLLIKTAKHALGSILAYTLLNPFKGILVRFVIDKQTDQVYKGLFDCIKKVVK